jgi:hypothetical protein
VVFFYRLQRQGNSKVQDTMVERIGEADDEDECVDRSIDSGVGALGSSTTVWPVEHDGRRTLQLAVAPSACKQVQMLDYMIHMPL